MINAGANVVSARKYEQGGPMSGDHKRAWHERIREFIHPNENVWIVAAVVLLVILASYILDMENAVAVLILCGAVLIVPIAACLVKRRITFNDDALLVETRLFGGAISRSVYEYSGIYKFILAQNYRIIKFRKYALYVDAADRIDRIKTERYYHDCIKIMEQIKDKAGKLVYDATDEYYGTEDDLFRNYYKMKRMVKDVKDGP
jgi:hypothetical protein